MDYNELYNKAAFAAIKCKKERVRANQINQLLTIFNSNAMKDIEQVLLLLMAFITRQTSRNLFRRESSSAIIKVLKDLYDEEIEENEKIKSTREYLGLIKWLSEGAERIRLDFNVDEASSFDSLIKDFLRPPRQNSRSN